MGAVVVCGRAKSAPGGAAAPRVRRGPLARESSGAGPGCSPQAPRRASSSTGSPTRPPAAPGTAHDPGDELPVAGGWPPSCAPVLLVGVAVAAAPARAAADPVPVGVWPLQPDARGGRRVRPAGRALGLRPPRRRPARLPGTSGARRAGRHGVLRREFSRVAGVVVVVHGDTRTTYEPVEATVAGRPGGRPRRGHRPPAGRRLALSPAGVPALGLAARPDLPRPARPGRRRPRPVAAAVARRAASR